MKKAVDGSAMMLQGSPVMQNQSDQTPESETPTPEPSNAAELAESQLRHAAEVAKDNNQPNRAQAQKTWQTKSFGLARLTNFLTNLHKQKQP